MQLPSPVRLLGIDLGITSDHTAVVIDDAGSICARRRARSTVASLAALEAAALDGAELGTQLVVVIEPTGPAWLPVAVFFGRRGHAVLRVSAAKAADLRRFLARHAKSNARRRRDLGAAAAGRPHRADRGRVRQPGAGVAGSSGAGRGPADCRDRPAQDPYPDPRPAAGPDHWRGLER
jgi:transposase